MRIQFNQINAQVTKLVAKLDEAVGYVQKRLMETGLDKRVNVIYLSDHGMNSVKPPNFINLNDFLTADCCTMYGTSPILQIVPKDLSMYGSHYNTQSNPIMRVKVQNEINFALFPFS